ncbi:MAG TPA: hypothetical protein VLB29_14010 [Nocardioidaceae bacterium]|nr:hypothetical protein [Nocardioidaceae bacterium]
MSRNHRLIAVVTALGTATAGLVAGALAGPAQANTATATQTVEVFVKRDHNVDMSTTELQPGVTKFAISSRRSAGFQIAQAASGYNKREAARDINRAFNENNLRALRRFEANMTLLGGMPTTAKKSATMSVKLAEGTYWALDTMPRRLDPAKILEFTVAGESVGGRLSGHVIRATGEHKWGKASPRIPTRGRIVFRNPSSAPHFIAIVKLARGKTMKDFRAWINEQKQGNQSPPPVNFNVTLDTGVITTGQSMAFKYRLPRGRYVLTCWWPDSNMGGMPHALMGMYRGLRVG